MLINFLDDSVMVMFLGREIIVATRLSFLLAIIRKRQPSGV